MESSANQVCTGNWRRHKVGGKLQRKWGWFWRTADSNGTGWNYVDTYIWAYLYKNCRNNNPTDWRAKARGTVQNFSGRSASETDLSDVVHDVLCGL